MAVKTDQPIDLTVSLGRFNRFEITQVRIDTPPGTTTAAIEMQAVLVDDNGTRQSFIKMPSTLLSDGPLERAMADTTRRILVMIAAGLKANVEAAFAALQAWQAAAQAAHDAYTLAVQAAVDAGEDPDSIPLPQIPAPPPKPTDISALSDILPLVLGADDRELAGVFYGAFRDALYAVKRADGTLPDSAA